MVDPSVSQEVVESIYRAIKRVEETPNCSRVREYIDFVFKRIDELTWSEFEYLINLLFIHESCPAFSLKFPKISDSQSYKEFFGTLGDESKKYFEKKISLLPLSTPLYVLDAMLSDEEKSPQWDGLIQKVAVDTLPTQKCYLFIDYLGKCLNTKIDKLPSSVTKTQEIIEKKMNPKVAITEIFKQNSKCLIGMFASKKDTEDQTTEMQIEGKRERKITLIKMDFETIAKGFSDTTSDKTNTRENLEYTEHNAQKGRPAKGESRSSQNRFRPFSKTDVPYSSIPIGTLPPVRVPELTSGFENPVPNYGRPGNNPPWMGDVDVTRSIGVYENQNTDAFNARFQRIQHIMKTKDVTLMDIPADVIDVSTHQPDISDVFK
ncbi:hypothetical protein EIN_390330 [Entamoeba invadens IP1]|uniref:Uncharacterized protein n=1 Tax=Entamoeba invadens IP1 TaxID=370355 RepID=A0A0A1U8L3_ENTIV|nr:hypothetical protein EIN_390330 [Entamoeba invadens IP1]ELP89418.1 hypothetical protein EIN_390330 [Entamoeba invadens IP1]|eukprot:XP_004256189.1 hypothetical protein EIN_390330 [Entamoeba invadens IP1]